MKNKLKLFIGIGLLSLMLSANAGSIGGYCGTIDTESLGDASVVGGYTTFDVVPFVDLYLSAAYVSEFEILESNNGNSFLGELTKRYKIDDFCLVPIEAGLIAEVGVLDIVEIYCGAGVAYYVLPEFTLISEGNSFQTDVEVGNLFGWWGKLGVAIGVPHVKVFAEAKLSKLNTHNVDIDVKTDYFSYKDTIEIDFSNVQLLVGARLEF